ncbi:polysaccharide pyruvyl transferase family protein [Priestia sp. GS2]|uniref:polysaccharide pyruvyl transferase family protein n=1 Tax=Priestia sp. GS2 TaxID=3117403 RepID=UPI002ED9C408
MTKLKSKIKRFVPKSLKYNAYYYFGGDYSEKFNKNNNPRVFIMLAGDYENLGDIAITEAQKKFIKKVLPNHEVIPIYLRETLKMVKTIKKVIQPSDIITIIGGGNMGDLYEGYENMRRNLIKSFPNNKIISFPQTIDFSNSVQGKKSFEKTIKYYNSHQNLHLFARESISHRIMEKAFPNNTVKLIPDIVLSMELESKKALKREGVVLCLRNDSEINLKQDTKDSIIKVIKGKFTAVSFQDTHLGNDTENGSFKSLQSSFYDLLNSFSKAELVITDRLHGMIFCVITGTPCIVLPNNNHKITGTYHDWLNNVDYIKLVTKVDNITSFLKDVDSMLMLDTNSIKIPNLEKYYHPLQSSLKL